MFSLKSSTTDSEQGISKGSFQTRVLTAGIATRRPLFAALVLFAVMLMSIVAQNVQSLSLQKSYCGEDLIKGLAKVLFVLV